VHGGHHGLSTHGSAHTHHPTHPTGRGGGGGGNVGLAHPSSDMGSVPPIVSSSGSRSHAAPGATLNVGGLQGRNGLPTQHVAHMDEQEKQVRGRSRERTLALAHAARASLPTPCTRASQPPSPNLKHLTRQEEKKRLKRAANRRSACTSRARKKQYVEEMTMANKILKKHAHILELLPDLILGVGECRPEGLPMELDDACPRACACSASRTLAMTHPRSSPSFPSVSSPAPCPPPRL
jgi:hypothetical protein